MAGLTNLGNTCFIASVLQGLSSCRTLLEILRRECRIQQVGANVTLRDASIGVLARLGAEEAVSGKAFAPTSFVQVLRARYKSFGLAQQDAEEVFLILADSLFGDLAQEDVGLAVLTCPDIMTAHRSITIPCSPAHSAASRYLILTAGENSLNRDAFQEDFGILHCAQQSYTDVFRKYYVLHPLRGFLTSTLRCSVCGGHHEIKVDSFFDLSLSIPALSFGCNAVLLEECLRSWSEPETVHGALCDRCLLTTALDVLEKRRKQICTVMSVMPTHARKDIESSLAIDIECLSSAKNSLPASSSLPEAIRSMCRKALDGQPAGAIVKRLSIARPPPVRPTSHTAAFPFQHVPCRSLVDRCSAATCAASYPPPLASARCPPPAPPPPHRHRPIASKTGEGSEFCTA
jgi:hypothetical protein